MIIAGNNNNPRVRIISFPSATYFSWEKIFGSNCSIIHSPHEYVAAVMSACSFFPWSPDVLSTPFLSHWMTSSFPASLRGLFIFNVHLLLLILLVELRPSVHAGTTTNQGCRRLSADEAQKAQCIIMVDVKRRRVRPAGSYRARGPQQNMSTDRCFSAHCTWHCFDKKIWPLPDPGRALRQGILSPLRLLEHTPRWRLFPGHDNASSIHRNVVAAR